MWLQVWAAMQPAATASPSTDEQRVWVPGAG